MCATQPPNVILLLEWGIVRVKCLVQEHSMVNSALVSSFLEYSKWIEAHWPTNHKAIAFPAYSWSRATINYFFFINNFGKSLLQLYHVLKLVLSRATIFYLTTHENTSFLACGEVVSLTFSSNVQSFLTFTVLLSK